MKWIPRWRAVRPSTKAILALYLCSAGFTCVQVLRYLNWYHYDLAGHASGGIELLRVGLHGFNERVFLGLTQDLFYPPLEDFILLLLKILTGAGAFQIFPVYLAGVLVLFLGSQASFVLGLRRGLVRGGLAVALLWLFHLDKTGSARMQGWSVFDAAIVGLSSQFLSGIGFFQLLRLGFSERKVSLPSAIGWALFCLLSHLVTGLLAFGVLLGIGIKDRWKLRQVGITAFSLLAGSAFFTLPFLAYRSYLVSSAIYYNHSSVGLLFFLGALAVTIGIRSPARYWVAFATLLFAPLILLPRLETLGISVPFHFYRLAMPAWILLFSGLALALDRIDRCGLWFLLPVLLGSAAFQVIESSPWFDPGPDGLPAREARIEVERVPQEFFVGGGGRTLVLGRTRASDFGLDFRLLEVFPGFSTLRGLHWEGSYANPVVSSYLATAFSPPVVLDYLSMDFPDCESFGRMLLQMVDVLDIGSFVWGQEELLQIPETRRRCWARMLDQGFPGFPFASSGRILYSGEWKRIVVLDRRLHAAAVPITPGRIHFPAALGKYPYFGEVMQLRFRAALEQHRPAPVSLLPEEGVRFQEWRGRVGDGDPTPGLGPLHSSSPGRFELEIPGRGMWVHFRMNPQPGLRIEDANGQSIPWFKGLPGVVFFGVGKVTLIYGRTPLMKLAYLISILFVSGWILFFIKTVLSPVNRNRIRSTNS